MQNKIFVEPKLKNDTGNPHTKLSRIVYMGKSTERYTERQIEREKTSTFRIKPTKAGIPNEKNGMYVHKIIYIN